MIIGTILDDAYNLVDMYWVGKLGPEAVAAVALSGIIMGTASVLAFGVSIGTMALVSRFQGMRQPRNASRVVAQSILLALALGVLTALGGALLAGSFLRLLGAAPEVVQQGGRYLRIVAVGSVMGYLCFVLNSALRASGDAVTPMIATGIANTVNCIFDPLLIFGWLGMPKLGVAGAAYATVGSQGVALAIVLYIFFVRGHAHFDLHVRDLRPEWPMLKRIFNVGVFGSGQALVRNLSALAVMRVIAAYGQVPAQAAYGIVMRVWFAVLMPGIGFGNAAATLVGQNLGARKPHRAARAAWVSTGTFVAVAAVASAVFMLVPHAIVRIFNNDPGVVEAGGTFMRLLGATIPFMCLSAVLGRALQGAGDTLSPMIITTFAMFILRVPLAYLLALRMGSVTGAWIAFAASDVVQGAMFGVWFATGRWKHKTV
jgi:putative MATE family efflux protein